MPDSGGARRDITRVIAAEGISNFGSMLSRLAIPWIATLSLDATPAAMALLLVTDVAAGVVASLWLGPLIDRSRKRLAMLWCDALRALVLLGLAWAAWRGAVTMGALVAAAAASGVLTIAFDLARSAWTAQRIAADELPRRNAQLSMAGSVSETLAFAVGGWLYQVLGAALALAIDALSYLGSAWMLRGVREVAPDVAWHGRVSTRGSWWHDQREGWRVLRDHARLRALGFVEALSAFGGSLAGTSYMVYVARDLALATGVQGLVFAVGGVGSVLGAALAPRLGRRLGAGRAMACGLMLAALAAVCIPLATGAGAAALALLVAHQVVGDGGQTVHDVHDRTLRQTAVAPLLLARVDAGLRAIGQSSTLVGAAVGGALGTAVSARSVLVLSAASMAAAALVAACTLARTAPTR